jgi:hypothetical protein
MRPLVSPARAHYTPLDLRERSSVVPSIAVASAGRRRAAVSERIHALLSSDDYGSSVERHGGCHPVYANARGGSYRAPVWSSVLIRTAGDLPGTEIIAGGNAFEDLEAARTLLARR